MGPTFNYPLVAHVVSQELVVFADLDGCEAIIVSMMDTIQTHPFASSGNEHLSKFFLCRVIMNGICFQSVDLHGPL
jgi:hypothetical protein